MKAILNPFIIEHCVGFGFMIKYIKKSNIAELLFLFIAEHNANTSNTINFIALPPVGSSVFNRIIINIDRQLAGEMYEYVYPNIKYVAYGN